MTDIYTFGYQGHRPEDLVGLLDRIGGRVLDIRFNPASRNPAWSKSRLQALLGDRYQHVKAFGNSAYKTDRIEIVDYEAGRQVVEASPAPVVLMCACKDLGTCHRLVVAEMLLRDGHCLMA